MQRPLQLALALQSELRTHEAEQGSANLLALAVAFDLPGVGLIGGQVAGRDKVADAENRNADQGRVPGERCAVVRLQARKRAS